MTEFRDRAVALYDAFTHEHHDRRRLLKQMTLLAGSTAAAEALIAGLAASPAAAALTEATDPRLSITTGQATFAGQPLTTYRATLRTPRAGGGVVLVIHENRGLTPHIRDVTRRLALAGFTAIAPDFLSAQGGTPADEDAARTLIGSADYDLILAQAVALIEAEAKGGAKVGAVGFCWGGAFVNRLALAAGARLRAGVAYYGPAPSPAEAAKIQTPLLLHYAGKDARVAQTGTPWVAALKLANKPVQAFVYPGVDHAFNNDSSAERYDKAAATLAWGRTLAFLHARLDR
ncbi:carboxymethylenebutenolidase [Sphingomonas sp. SORGH_AS802]|uniref:dienelactone hydrolase family protein n=1 Tax=unclassified Sphingomonas TaxID=196159 RepID=UPI002862A67C|nr:MULTISPECIES: dienelactone hydrolase family protein [unclassified Sphingomonas]MDR6127959.1 carboxymethylenebutenolidase [Sphingomonas sp. SORGH_AS_0438]MDR6133131.1 carboxymethylenebutenolidase [Sphingomonas sp. SORGH_AS_0802]